MICYSSHGSECSWVALLWIAGWLGSVLGSELGSIYCISVCPSSGWGKGKRLPGENPCSINIKPGHTSTCNLCASCRLMFLWAKHVTWPSPTSVGLGVILCLQWKVGVVGINICWAIIQSIIGRDQMNLLAEPQPRWFTYKRKSLE